MLNLKQEEIQANIERLLFLVIDNSKTSATRAGLIRRSKNEMEIETILTAWLEIDSEQADDMYWRAWDNE